MERVKGGCRRPTEMLGGVFGWGGPWRPNGVGELDN